MEKNKLDLTLSEILVDYKEGRRDLVDSIKAIKRCFK
jgi:hypothetical protein